MSEDGAPTARRLFWADSYYECVCGEIARRNFDEMDGHLSCGKHLVRERRVPSSEVVRRVPWSFLEKA